MLRLLRPAGTTLDKRPPSLLESGLGKGLSDAIVHVQSKATSQIALCRLGAGPALLLHTKFYACSQHVDVGRDGNCTEERLVESLYRVGDGNGQFAVSRTAAE